MTTDMVIFLDAERGVRATDVFGESAPNRAGLGSPLPRQAGYRRGGAETLREPRE